METQHLPWATEPSAAGATRCGWCDRDIQMPAHPCSAHPVEGLARMKTEPGLGARCQYELSTRRPDVLAAGHADADLSVPSGVAERWPR